MRNVQTLFFLLLFVLGAALSAVAHAEATVVRALFAQSIIDREPVDQTDELSNDNNKIFFFTELRGLSGKRITHRWEYAGEPRAAVTFRVVANRWRTWSSKNLQLGWTGVWTVLVVDEEGNVLAEKSLNYVAAESNSKKIENKIAGEEPAE